MKITVKLDEGMEYTVERKITEQLMMLLSNKNRLGEGLPEVLVKEAANGAQQAMKGIIRVLDKEGTLYTYNKRLENGMFERRVHVIKDIGEFLKLRKDLLKTQTEEETEGCSS